MLQDASSAVPDASARDKEEQAEHGGGNFWVLAMGSMGVVFGDIGTSPLYSLQTAMGLFKDGGVTEATVVGSVSLIVWALLIVVTAKYVLFLMQADNKGEGGILSLQALARTAIGKNTGLVFLLGVAGAALFSGDAIITPAISVLSALEGLKQVNPDLGAYVLPATVVILIALFLVQRRGTAGVAAFFGPIMLVFFAVSSVLGLMQIAHAYIILSALSPLPGLKFLWAHGTTGFIVLGSVFLAVTGAEALYADMGHFGRRPIQAAWLFVVLPALICNYLGQGALILSNPKAIENPFYLLAPTWALMPLVVLSTAATVIASQAVITGAYSLVSQAIHLGLLPKFEIVHTSDTLEGQIYVPRVNWLLLVGVLALVFLFKSSDALANAYGIAVAGTMVATTSLAFFVVWKLWGWPLWRAALLIAAFLSIDVAFFIANLYKVLDGGYVPLMLGSVSFVCMWTWARGSQILTAKTRRDAIPLTELLKMLEKSKPTRVPGTAVFLTGDVDLAPASFMHNLKHNKVVHERVVMMCVCSEPRPRIPHDKRFEIKQVSPDFITVKLHYGYMERPRIPVALAGLRKLGLKFDIMTTSFFLGRRSLKPAQKSELPKWQAQLFMSLAKQATSTPNFFHIPSDRVVELGAQMKL
jgi:KUP system potassium uptake protein